MTCTGYSISGHLTCFGKILAYVNWLPKVEDDKNIHRGQIEDYTTYNLLQQLTYRSVVSSACKTYGFPCHVAKIKDFMGKYGQWPATFLLDFSKNINIHEKLYRHQIRNIIDIRQKLRQNQEAVLAGLSCYRTSDELWSHLETEIIVMPKIAEITSFLHQRGGIYNKRSMVCPSGCTFRFNR